MSLLRKLPQVNALLESPQAARMAEEFGREEVARAVRASIQAVRDRIKDGGEAAAAELAAKPAAILEHARAALQNSARPGLRRVINATGIILHTGLGRAVLPEAALAAIASECRSYSTLEVDPESGDRSHRERHVSRLLERITGAAAATVVNNNAAATMLALAALAGGKEVIISRGQLVEIGGAFRMPDVMALSGCRMVEVGTTNRTRLSDYENAITPNTGLLIRVHRSNFALTGFTEEPSVTDMVSLGKKHAIPVVDDIGSGALVDVSKFGITGEPLLRDSLAAGADAVFVSGDKLMGGPQAGILVGKQDAIAKMRRHPLFRAVRPDKLQLAALEATLRLYLDPASVESTIPTLRMMALPLATIEKRASAIVKGLKKAGVDATIEDEKSQVGGGSTPGQELVTRVVSIAPGTGGADALLARLRLGDPSVFARVQKDRILFDPRTVQESEDAELVAAIARALKP